MAADFSIDGLIRYFEMAHKVMGYTNPEENSYEYHAAKTLKQMQESQEKMRHMILALESENDNLARDYALVVSQRDEARQLFCEDRFHYGKHHRLVNGDLVVCTTPQEIADDLGWNC